MSTQNKPGRPPIPTEQKRVPFCLKLPRELLDYLATRENKTDAIEQALRRSSDFRKWKASR